VRVVLDSNVLIPAFAFGGICRAVFDVTVDAHELITSEHILREVHQTLVGKLRHPTDMANERIALLRQVATIVAPDAVPSDACRDANDLPVLGTLLAGKAECLVTGDKDLLDLHLFEGRSIVTPRQFWEGLK
jgi:uncharacterized protein